MTFNRFISATMAVALLAACSDKDPLGEGPDNGIGNPGENIGDGYVAVQINLPTNVVSAAPRATNDNFDDGLASEYAVTSAHLVLFNSDKEDEAVVSGVFTFKDLKPWNEYATIENVTTSANR